MAHLSLCHALFVALAAAGPVPGVRAPLPALEARQENAAAPSDTGSTATGSTALPTHVFTLPAWDSTAIGSSTTITIAQDTGTTDSAATGSILLPNLNPSFTTIGSTITGTATDGAGPTDTATDGSTTTGAGSSETNPVSSLSTSSSLPEATSAAVETCDNVNLRDQDAVKQLWNEEYGIALYLDQQLAELGEIQWVDRLAGSVFPGAGDTGAYGCSQRGQDCFNQALDCQSMSSNGNAEEYWIFTAVKNMQNMFEIAHSNLQDEVIMSSLSVSSIVSDFSLNQHANPFEDFLVLAYISAAFTMFGGAAAFANAQWRMLAGLAGGASIISSRALTETPTMIDASSLDSMLKSAFKAIRDSLDEYLALAVGEGSGAWDSLPNQAGDQGSPIARFFHDGVFLLQGEPEGMFSESFKWLTRALVNEGLKSIEYAVIGDRDTSETMCTSKNVLDSYGARWMPDIEGGRCFKLYMPEDRDLTGQAEWRTPGNEIFDKLEENYGFDLVEFYAAAYDCAVNGNGAPDVDNLPTDGTLPRCFYSIPSYQGFEVDPGGEFGVNYMDTEDWPR